MTDIAAIKNYLSKLQRVVVFDADFKFVNMELIKRNKIDDVLCCLIASLPDIFKKCMRSSMAKKYSSVTMFKTLYEKLGTKFFLNSKLYMINPDECKKLIGLISTTIERDIRIMENL